MIAPAPGPKRVHAGAVPPASNQKLSPLIAWLLLIAPRQVRCRWWVPALMLAQVVRVPVVVRSLVESLREE